jgi:hypothetical protein
MSENKIEKGDMENLIQCRQEFQDMFDELGEIVIAGGSVRDTLMGKKPKDIDIFLLGNLKEDIDDFVADKLQDFATLDLKLDWHKSEPFLLQSIQYKEMEVQFLATPHGTLEGLIDSFDWNICQFGLGEDGVIQKCEITEIDVGKYLKLNKVTYPYSTLRRGYRFSERFLMRLKTADIKTICNKIMELKGKENV